MEVMTAPLRFQCSIHGMAVVIDDAASASGWLPARPGDDLLECISRVGRADAPRALADWRDELRARGAARTSLRVLLSGGRRGTLTVTGVDGGDRAVTVVASFAGPDAAADDEAALDVRALLERLDAVYYELSRDEDGIWSANYASPAWEALLGRPMPEDPVERSNTWMASIHPEDAPAATARALDHARRRAPLVHEYRVVRADGGVRWVRDHVNGFGGSELRPRVVGVTIDITEGRRRDEHLAHILREIATVVDDPGARALPDPLRERLRGLLEGPPAITGPVPAATAAMHFSVRLAPDDTLEFHGDAPDLAAFLGRVPAAASDVVHPDDLESVLREVRALAAGPGQGSQVFRVVRADGAVRWVRTAFTLRPGDERVLIGSALDITAVADRPRTGPPPVVYEAHVGADGEWRNDYLSPAAVVLFGDAIPSDPRERARMFVERVHPEDRAAAGAAADEAIAGGGPGLAEFRIVHPEGMVRRVRSTLTRVGADPVRLTGVLTDISEMGPRPGSAVPAAEAERRLHFAESLEDVVMEFECSGRDVGLRYVGPSANPILGTPGLAPGERRAEAWLMAIHPLDRAGLLEAVRAAAGSAEVRRGAHRIVRTDGSVRWVRTVLRGGLEPANRRLVACVATDISDLAGDLSTESGAFGDRLDHLVAAVTDGIWEIEVRDPVTRDVEFSFVSRRMWEIIGRAGGSNEEFGPVLETAIHPEDRARTREQSAALLSGSLAPAEHRVVLPDGAVRWVRWSPAGAREADGGQWYAGTLRDITDEREPRPALPELTARQREVLDHLVAGASTEDMAAAMGIRPVTVSNHVAALLRRLGVRSRLEAVALARGAGGTRS